MLRPADTGLLDSLEGEVCTAPQFSSFRKGSADNPLIIYYIILSNIVMEIANFVKTRGYAKSTATLLILEGDKMKLDTIKIIGLLTILLCFAGGTIAWAAIPQQHIRCRGCHVEPGEGELLSQYAGNPGCVYCHSSGESSTTYELDLGGGMGQTVTVPVVVYTGASAPTNYLSGGNFWWVKEGLGGDDSKGHNIFSGEPDNNLSSAPGDATTCGFGPMCHGNLWQTSDLSGTRQGCTKCHMVNPGDGAYEWTSGFHHADDSNTVVGSDYGDTDGFFRFLTGHQDGSGHGVCGIEDTDWRSTSETDHSEYLGREVDLNDTGSLRVGLTNDPDNHTMTFFCSGCHGNIHKSSDSANGGDWIRHPAGAVLPSGGEFDDYTTFDPDTPVARPDPDFTDWTGPSSTVTPGTDLVNCLSCHRAHGSPYPKMLRWDLNGCKKCHTSK